MWVRLKNYTLQLLNGWYHHNKLNTIEYKKIKKEDLIIIKKWWEAWPKWVAPADDFYLKQV